MEGKDAALQQVPGDPRVDKCFAVCIMPAGEGKDTRGLLDKKKEASLLLRDFGTLFRSTGAIQLS